MIGNIIREDDNFASVAAWCNENGAYIDEIAPDNDGRRFIVRDVPNPTEDEINAARIEAQTTLEARLSALEDALAELITGGIE